MSGGKPENVEVEAVVLSIGALGKALPPEARKSFLADMVKAFVQVQREMGQDGHTWEKTVRELLSGGKLLGLAKVLDPVVDVAAKFNKAEAQRARDALELQEQAAETALAVARAQLKVALVNLLRRCLDGKASAKKVGDKVHLIILAGEVLEAPRRTARRPRNTDKAQPAEE